MENSVFLQHVFSRANTHVFLQQEINLENHIRIVIDDIRSDRNTHIELDAFYDGFDLYRDLREKKHQWQMQVAQLDVDAPGYVELGTAIQQVDEEERMMRANILDLALTLDKAKDSEKIIQIRNAYTAGLLKQADGLLPEDYLLEQFNKYLQNEQHIRQVSEQLIDNANEFLVKAEITNLNYEQEDRFEKAVFYFEKGSLSAKASRNLPFFAGFQYQFAYFLNRHRLFPEAGNLYKEALQLYQQLAEGNATYREKVVGALNNLAMICFEDDDFEQSEQLYQEAIEHCTDLVRLNESAYLPLLSTMLNNIGTLQDHTRKHAAAETNYHKALKIRRELCETEPEIYDMEVARTLNNLAILYQDKNQYKKATAFYSEALDLYRKMSAKNPQAYKVYVALTLNNFAVLYRQMNELEQAKICFLEALDIYTALRKINPKVYLPDVGRVSHNLGILYADLNQFKASESAYRKALKIRRFLVKDNAATYLPDLALTLSNAANLFLYQHKHEKAESYMMEALNIRRNLVEIDPDYYASHLAMTLNDLGQLYIDQQNFFRAETTYQEALGLYQTLAEANPEVYLPDLGRTMVNLSIFYLQNLPDKIQSIQFAREAIKTTLPFREFMGLTQQQVVDIARQVLEAWGEDPASILKEITQADTEK